MEWQVDPGAEELEQRQKLMEATEALKPLLLRTELLRNMMRVVGSDEETVREYARIYFAEAVRLGVELTLLDHDYELHRKTARENGSNG
jgi:hypothetical protein